MTMRMIGAVCVIVGTTSMGFLCSWKYEKRIVRLEEIYGMLLMLHGEIECRDAAFFEAFLSIGRQSSGVIKQFSEELAERIHSGSGQPFFEIWQDAVAVHFSDGVVTEADRDLLVCFGEKLGYLDKQMQLNTIQLFMKQIQERRSELQHQLPEKCKVSKCLGIVTGIFLTILIL